MNYLRYIGVSLGTQLAVAVTVWAMDRFLDVQISSSGMSMIPAMMAAMDQGDVFARKTGRVPEPGVAWRFAAIATLITICLSVGVTLLVGLFLPDEVAAVKDMFVGSRGLLGGAMVGFAALILGLVLVITLLISRFFVTFGAKNRLKSQKSVGP